MANSTWIVGKHAVEAVIRLNPERVMGLYSVLKYKPKASSVAKFEDGEIVDLARSLGISIHYIDKNELTKRVGTSQHQGMALLAQPKREGSETELEASIHRLAKSDDLKTATYLVLDQIQDPHNFGACLRTADAAGVVAVVVAKDNASPITPVVQKVASGAVETMPIYRVSNLARSLEMMKQAGIWVLGTSDKATTDLYEHRIEGPIALVMGAEGKGLRSLTEKKCDLLLSLPMAGSVVSSLNVSVATGVCLYEIARQRRASQS